MATFLELRKTKIMARQEEALRQLVSRYEQLAEKTLDAQQRVAADVSELRSRTGRSSRSCGRSNERNRFLWADRPASATPRLSPEQAPRGGMPT
jgi:hypothetical protein